MKPELIQNPAAADIEQAFTAAAAIEEVFTVAEIATKWKKSEDTVRRIFEDEPGVLRFGHGTLSVGRKYRRRYFSLRIPLAVFQRVEARLQRPRPSPITDPGSGFIVGTSNISVDPNGGGSNLPSLSVYLVGAGTGTVVSTPAGINCSGSGTGCTAYFPQGSTVTLKATPSSGSFGGWSANCTPNTASPCSVTMNTNQTVGAIFN